MNDDFMCGIDKGCCSRQIRIQLGLDKNCFAVREILRTIKLELIQGSQDCRRQLEEPSKDEEFLIMI
ncbi:hypothetical protein Dimus_010745 [Dionaea muscipula]